MRSLSLRTPLQDWSANRSNPRGRLVMVSFRIANMASRWRGVWRLPRVLIGSVYRVLIEWILGVELPWKTSVGPGLRLYHGVGIVINDGAIIGSDVVLRQNVTIGHIRAGQGSPTIEDRVQFGAGAIVLGEITVGHDSRIGPGVVLTNSVPPFSRVTVAAPTVRSRADKAVEPGEHP